MLLNDQQRKVILLCEFAPEPMEGRIEGLTDADGVSLDALDGTEPELKGGTKNSFRLLKEGIVVRDRSKVELCEGCLRITVGTEKENAELIEALRSLS